MLVRIGCHLAISTIPCRSFSFTRSSIHLGSRGLLEVLRPGSRRLVEPTRSQKGFKQLSCACSAAIGHFAVEFYLDRRLLGTKNWNANPDRMGTFLSSHHLLDRLHAVLSYVARNAQSARLVRSNLASSATYRRTARTHRAEARPQWLKRARADIPTFRLRDYTTNWVLPSLTGIR